MRRSSQFLLEEAQTLGDPPSWSGDASGPQPVAVQPIRRTVVNVPIRAAAPVSVRAAQPFVSPEISSRTVAVSSTRSAELEALAEQLKQAKKVLNARKKALNVLEAREGLLPGTAQGSYEDQAVREAQAGVVELEKQILAFRAVPQAAPVVPVILEPARQAEIEPGVAEPTWGEALPPPKRVSTVAPVESELPSFSFDFGSAFGAGSVSRPTRDLEFNPAERLAIEPVQSLPVDAPKAEVVELEDATVAAQPAFMDFLVSGLSPSPALSSQLALTAQSGQFNNPETVNWFREQARTWDDQMLVERAVEQLTTVETRQGAEQLKVSAARRDVFQKEDEEREQFEAAKARRDWARTHGPEAEDAFALMKVTGLPFDEAAALSFQMHRAAADLDYEAEKLRREEEHAATLSEQRFRAAESRKQEAAAYAQLKNKLAQEVSAIPQRLVEPFVAQAKEYALEHVPSFAFDTLSSWYALEAPSQEQINRFTGKTVETTSRAEDSEVKSMISKVDALFSKFASHHKGPVTSEDLEIYSMYQNAKTLPDIGQRLERLRDLALKVNARMQAKRPEAEQKIREKLAESFSSAPAVAATAEEVAAPVKRVEVPASLPSFNVVSFTPSDSRHNESKGWIPGTSWGSDRVWVLPGHTPPLNVVWTPIKQEHMYRVIRDKSGKLVYRVPECRRVINPDGSERLVCD